LRNTFIDGLLKIATNDKRIMLLTGDLGYGVVDNFARNLPDQFLNFGINEQTMMGAAAGLASQGYKPYVYSIGNFPTFRCLEQIRNDVCYMDLDVTIVALGAGFAYGTAGYSHHLIEDISAISPLPNIQIFSPADVRETERVIHELVKNSGPQYVRLGKGGEGDLTAAFDMTKPGFSISEGSNDVLVLSTGNILGEVIKLRGENLKVNPTIASCYGFSELPKYLAENQFRKIVTVEEHILRGGFGSLVREIVSTSGAQVLTLAINQIDSHVSGSQAHLRKKYGLTVARIIESLEDRPNGTNNFLY
jgi:transketolase